MRARPVFASFLLSLTVFSCQCTKCEEPQPQPSCYAGVVVGDACLDGVLIEVDAATPIGRPAGRLGNNVVAAVNFADLAGLDQVGQRVYFTYREDPNQRFANRGCTANTFPLGVPHLVLGNLATAACAPGSAR